MIFNEQRILHVLKHIDGYVADRNTRAAIHLCNGIGMILGGLDSPGTVDWDFKGDSIIYYAFDDYAKKNKEPFPFVFDGSHFNARLNPGGALLITAEKPADRLKLFSSSLRDAEWLDSVGGEVILSGFFPEKEKYFNSYISYPEKNNRLHGLDVFVLNDAAQLATKLMYLEYYKDGTGSYETMKHMFDAYCLIRKLGITDQEQLLEIWNDHKDVVRGFPDAAIDRTTILAHWDGLVKKFNLTFPNRPLNGPNIPRLSDPER